MKINEKREKRRERKGIIWRFTPHSSLLSLLLLLLTLHSSLITPHSLAQTASSSGSLIQKLDQLKKEIASKAAQIKNEVDKKVQNRAIFGQILKIDETSITLRALTSEKTINFNEFTQVTGSKNKKITLKTLEVSDNIAALGDFDDKNILSAVKLVFLESDSWRTAATSGTLFWGQIQNSLAQVITIKDKEGIIVNILTTPKTQFYLGNNESSLRDAKAEKFLAVRGTKLKDGSILARFVYFIPSVGFVKPDIKIASPSSKDKI